VALEALIASLAALLGEEAGLEARAPAPGQVANVSL